MNADKRAEKLPFFVSQQWYIFAMDHSIRVNTLYDRIGGREGLSKLLHHFYADVRQHQLIGPIFNAQISDWPEHLELIAYFWTRLTGGPSFYSGNVPGKNVFFGFERRTFSGLAAALGIQLPQLSETY